MKSPLSFGYRELIKYQELEVIRAKARKQKAQETGIRDLSHHSRGIRIAERILSLLKKGYQEPQTDLFDIFNKHS